MFRSSCRKIKLGNYHEIGRCGDNIYVSGKENLLFCKFFAVAQSCKLNNISHFCVSCS